MYAVRSCSSAGIMAREPCVWSRWFRMLCVSRDAPPAGQEWDRPASPANLCRDLPRGGMSGRPHVQCCFGTQAAAAAADRGSVLRAKQVRRRSGGRVSSSPKLRTSLRRHSASRCRPSFPATTGTCACRMPASSDGCFSMNAITRALGPARALRHASSRPAGRGGLLVRPG
jgi:hypothetical protein